MMKNLTKAWLFGFILENKPQIHNPTYYNYVSNNLGELLVGLNQGCLILQLIPSLQKPSYTLPVISSYKSTEVNMDWIFSPGESFFFFFYK